MRLMAEFIGRWSPTLNRALTAAIVVSALSSMPAPGAGASLTMPTASPRNANYKIEATLDVESKQLNGVQTLTWTNIQSKPTDQLWFHLYWNAWRNDRSTWMLENRIRTRRGTPKDIRPGDWSWQVVDAARLMGSEFEGERFPEADLSSSMFWASPDDGNLDDRTVMVIQLPRQVQPGETIQLEMSWRAKIPRTFARTGFRGESYFIAHWFPKLGVYEADGWNCHQFHAATEFYSDYGNYQVKLRLPSSFLVGATGIEVDSLQEDSDYTVHTFEQRDVHGFAWTASANYIEKTRTFEEPNLGRVQMRLLIQPENQRQAERHLDAAYAALKHYGHWFGPYPYEQVTLIDPAWGLGAGGMEYPTFFTCGTRYLSPPGTDRPESVTVHEAGHQFWYGVVGNNEFEHAWLDEGLNTYSTARTLNAAYPEPVLERRYIDVPGTTKGRGFFPVLFHEIPVDRLNRRIAGVRKSPVDDVPATHTYRYYPNSAGNISYSQTALWLETLERHLGWDVLREILSTFYHRYAFAHPTPDDFFAVAEEIGGEDLRGFFDQVHRSAVEFDYAIRKVESFPVKPKGWIEEQGTLTYIRRASDDDEDEDEDGGVAGNVAGNVDEYEFGAETATGDSIGSASAEGDPDGTRDGNADTAAEDPAQENAGSATSEVTSYRSRVFVQRKGAGIFPVEILAVFEDGTEMRRQWDGTYRWAEFGFVHSAKLSYAVVDPDRVLMLDTHPQNNSKKRKPKAAKPAVKWASKWVIWVQDLMSTLSFYV